MARLTAIEAKENEIKKLIRNIWEKECGRSKDELSLIKIDVTYMTTIKIDDRTIEIHYSLFDDYFSSSNTKAQKQGAVDKIKECLLGKI